MKHIISPILATFMASAAMAECPKPEDNLFSCTFENGAKTVELCMIDAEPLPQVSYKFGNTGEKPEHSANVLFSQSPQDDGYELWVQEPLTTLHIRSKNFEYALIAQMKPQLSIAHLINNRGVIGSIFFQECDKGSETGAIGSIWDKFEQAGWRYIRNEGDEFPHWEKPE